MAMDKRVFTTAIMLSILFIPSLAEAQAPTPPSVPTLGPVIICSAGDSATNVRIISPQNDQNYPNNQVQLNFTVQALGMFGQFGNIGYNLDGGIINSVNSFGTSVVHPTDAPDWYWDRTTAFANVILPELSEGVHNVTVYYGWQYLGIPQNPSLERFEVYAYASANFTVGNSIDNSLYPNSSPSLSPSPTSFPTLTVSLFESASALYYGNTVNFTVLADGGTKPYTFAWYIDGQMAQTSASPYFSTDSQAVGSHHVYVQVTDVENNSATTLTVEFNVLSASSSSPGLSPTLSSSPTQQPTTEPSPTPIVDRPIWFTPTSVAMIFLAATLFAVIAISIVIYFRKTENKTRKI